MTRPQRALPDIRSQADIDAETSRSARIRAHWLHRTLHDKPAHYAGLRNGDLARTGSGLSLLQALMAVALCGALTGVLLLGDPLGIIWEVGQ